MSDCRLRSVHHAGGPRRRLRHFLVLRVSGAQPNGSGRRRRRRSLGPGRPGPGNVTMRQPRARPNAWPPRWSQLRSGQRAPRCRRLRRRHREAALRSTRGRDRRHSARPRVPGGRRPAPGGAARRKKASNSGGFIRSSAEAGGQTIHRCLVPGHQPRSREPDVPATSWRPSSSLASMTSCSIRLDGTSQNSAVVGSTTSTRRFGASTPSGK